MVAEVSPFGEEGFNPAAVTSAFLTCSIPREDDGQGDLEVVRKEENEGPLLKEKGFYIQIIWFCFRRNLKSLNVFL